MEEHISEENEGTELDGDELVEVEEVLDQLNTDTNDNSTSLFTTQDMISDEEVNQLMEELDQEENEQKSLTANEKVVEVTTPSSSSSGYKKKTTPDEPAKNFQLGDTLVSNNDNKTYQVIITKSGVKRWKKISP